MSELRNRVEAKKKRLEAEILEKKADAQGATTDAVRALKAKLNELEKLIGDGWDDLSEAVQRKLTEWLR